MTNEEQLVLSVSMLKLSDFETTENINKNDLFLAAKNNQVKSCSTQLSTIGEYALDNIETRCMVPAGQWNFNGPKAMINIPLSALSSDNNVPNIRYAYETLISKLNELSTKLYTDDENLQVLPSYKGMVVLGNNFDNAKKLTRLYGSHTKWKKIEGRFIFGAGPCTSNNTQTYGSMTAGEISLQAKRYGGTNKVKLNGLPKHSHRFSPGMESEVHFGKMPVAGIEFDLDYTWLTENIEKLSNPAGTLRHSGKWGMSSTEAAVKPQQNTDINPGIVEKEWTFKAQGELLENTSSWRNEPHNNIPPFYVTHIWERVK